MKNYLLLFLLVITSCTKNNSSLQYSSISSSSVNSESVIVPAKAPPASAFLNGIQWYGDNIYCVFSTNCHPGKVYLRIEKHDDVGNLIEMFDFDPIIPDTTLIQKIYSPKGCFNDTLGGDYFTTNDDVLIGSYFIKNTSDNYFKLDRFDTITKVVSGRFAGTYLKLDGEGVKKIVVTDGRFYGKVSN